VSCSQKEYVRLLWAMEGSQALEQVRHQLSGVSVEAVTRLMKAADQPVRSVPHFGFVLVPH
jgi:hypothetical protein